MPDDLTAKFHVAVPDAAYWRRQIKCQDACPVHTDARGYVCAIADGDLERAYITAREPNPFASICGRVCAAPCEAACRRRRPAGGGGGPPPGGGGAGRSRDPERRGRHRPAAAGPGYAPGEGQARGR